MTDIPVVTVDAPATPMPAPPAAGGRLATAAGLPYPSPQDPVCDTDRYIRELSDAVDLALATSSIAVFVGGLTTNSNGDVIVAFTSFASISGGVAHCIQNSTSGSLPLICQVWLLNGQLALRFLYVPSNGYLPVPYVGGLTAAVICWGVPK